jgi:hypothetical protein
MAENVLNTSGLPFPKARNVTPAVLSFSPRTFLFSFIGISASDFFCPNLATIASYLGLNESTAGVTFLAFGNGSPDVSRGQLEEVEVTRWTH